MENKESRLVILDGKPYIVPAVVALNADLLEIVRKEVSRDVPIDAQEN